MGGATGGRGVGGDNVLPLLGPAGYRRYRGRSNENDLCFYSRQSLFRTVPANFNTFNRPLLIFACLYPPHLEIPGIISKHTLLDVSGLKSDRALYKVWHIAATRLT